MQEEISRLKTSFDEDMATAKIDGNFDTLYLKYFSKTHGLVTILMKELPTASIEVKKKLGPALNELQRSLKDEIEKERGNYSRKIISTDNLDLSYKADPANSGMLHPTTQVIREMNNFFRYHGYSIAEGPEIENVTYNFRRLNLPEGHPATDLQDTLFINEPDILLRTHTSSIEARVLENYKPPIRIVVPGKVFRNETLSKSNASFFYQYQGVVVDKGITIRHLKGVLLDFHRFLFGEDVVIRFRYKYYPEVSPGMGTDIQCKFCKGVGCTTCKYRGWIEVLGSGMIHYNTLKMSGIDPQIYSGFAFGIGLDRVVMAKYQIPDIRKLYGGEMVYIN
jgi:phenylalanyl-tRNA synthetase alpha chain